MIATNCCDNLLTLGPSSALSLALAMIAPDLHFQILRYANISLFSFPLFPSLSSIDRWFPSLFIGCIFWGCEMGFSDEKPSKVPMLSFETWARRKLRVPNITLRRLIISVCLWICSQLGICSRGQCRPWVLGGTRRWVYRLDKGLSHLQRRGCELQARIPPFSLRRSIVEALPETLLPGLQTIGTCSMMTKQT